jgi:hypothetical protein
MTLSVDISHQKHHGSWNVAYYLPPACIPAVLHTIVLFSVVLALVLVVRVLVLVVLQLPAWLYCCPCCCQKWFPCCVFVHVDLIVAASKPTKQSESVSSFCFCSLAAPHQVRSQ